MKNTRAICTSLSAFCKAFLYFDHLCVLFLSQRFCFDFPNPCGWMPAVNPKRDSENTPVKGGTVADLGEYYSDTLA